MVPLIHITVLIYTYERRDYIVKALNTVLKQNINRDLFEIIVIKGFLDENIDKLLLESGVRLIYLNEKSLGKKIAKGIEESRGEIITFLDDDDEYEPEKLKKISEIFDKCPETDYIHNSLVKINESGEVIDPNPSENPAKNIVFSTRKSSNALLSQVLRYRGDWYLSCMSVRKSVLLDDLNSLKMIDQSIDKFIFFVSINRGRNIKLIPDKLTRYRMHQSTTTYTGTKEDFIKKREVFFRNTIKTFDRIVSLSANYHRNELASCQLIQHKINLYFISGREDSKVTMPEFIEFLKCLRIEHSRYQLIWIGGFMLRRISLELSRNLYYRFFKISFKRIVVN